MSDVDYLTCQRQEAMYIRGGELASSGAKRPRLGRFKMVGWDDFQAARLRNTDRGGDPVSAKALAAWRAANAG